MRPNHTNTLSLLVSCAVVLATALAASGRQPKYPDGLYAELKTNKGLIVLLLEFEKTPMTVANFVGLAEGTIENKALPAGAPFFDGTVFHRVVAGHVIQAGMPKAAERGPGYTIPNEIAAGLDHGRAGMLGMANSGPHTNSSQFYITLGDRSYLDGMYTVFGHVVEGMAVVNAVVQGDVVERVTIVRVGAKASAFKTDNATFRRLVDEARSRVKAEDERREREEAAMIKSKWPNAIAQPVNPPSTSSSRGPLAYPPALVVVTTNGEGSAAQPGGKVKARYRGQFLDGRAFCSSAEQGRPMPGNAAEVFEYEVGGKVRITPALESALLAMKKGERRTVIARGASAYGASGFFATPKPGEKRFVIPPNTTLVYDVEVIEIQPPA